MPDMHQQHGLYQNFLQKYCKSLRNRVQLICLKFPVNVLRQRFADNSSHSTYYGGRALSLCPVLHLMIHFLLLKSYRIVSMPIVVCLMGIHVIESVYPLLVEKLGTWGSNEIPHLCPWHWKYCSLSFALKFPLSPV